MAASNEVFVRHVHTGEIKSVTADQRATQNKNYWVRVTGDDIKVTAPETDPPADDVESPAPKTASKASTPAK